TKGFTALVVMALVEAGTWSLGTTARSLLGGDLPLVDDAVTLEDLLAHRSGIGDYLDESDTADINDHVMPVPVHQLSSTEAYLPLLDGHPQVFTPGDRFAYNNGGFVLLALLAERATGRPFDRLVADLVCAPAGLTQTGFVRSDALPRAVATGYLDPDGWRTNALHLPVMGSGDGGLVTTVGDVRRFWLAVVAGRIVNPATLARMAEPRSDVPAEGKRYGLGLWLHPTGPQLALEGYDAGVSFRSWHHPLTGETLTVIGNTSNGAWPVVAALEAEIVPA
ncbi:MAG TPA: serine hydrolase domain-containing protein, partial [Actinotalea sp.]|nr:serine hydrolase domain-containing protein [Actinotalea sp.]